MTEPIPQNPPHPKPAEPERPYENVGLTVVVVFGVTAVILLLACPPLRDYLAVKWVGASDWSRQSRVEFVMWVEWVRIVFEAGLGLALSGLVFNKSFQNWSQSFAKKQEKDFLKLADEARKHDPTLQKIRELRDDIVILIFGKPQFFSFRDLWEVWKKAGDLKAHFESFRTKWVFAIGMWAWALRRFAGGLHGVYAASCFLIILLAKALKQFADSPVWSA